ncbi:MAG TPA: hypothetical protein VGP92_04490 [Acidimicrobiia bacterium]|nr:hypothetical protein [Acidimicrobiia bacterium]
MYAALLRRLTTNGFRKGMSGSTPWLVVGIAAGGLRVLHRLARDEEEVIYRTVVKAGDVFEVITRPKQ